MDALLLYTMSGQLLLSSQWETSLYIGRDIEIIIFEALDLQSTIDICDLSMLTITPNPLDQYYLVYRVYSDTVWVALSQKYSEAISISEFQERVTLIVSQYVPSSLTGQSLGQAIMQDHKFKCQIYLLLQEMIDVSGRVKCTEAAVLKNTVVCDKDYELDILQSALRSSSQLYQQRLSHIGESQLPWRQKASYSQEQIYLDIIETVSISTVCGKVIGQIDGTVLCKSRLSGMPEVQLELKNSHLIDIDASHVHQCVRLKQFAESRVLSFIPPDGQCELLDYVVPLTDQSQIPLAITPSISFSGKQGLLTITLQLKSDYLQNIQNIEVTVELPSDVDIMSIQGTQGEYYQTLSSEQCIKWAIPKLSLKDVCQLQAKLQMPGGDKDSQSNVNISGLVRVSFQVQRYLMSQLGIKRLSVDGTGKQDVYKGVRVSTRVKKYEIVF
ncbi:hypothetical protein MP228_002408 [Amoeboaphelidium protococcarum]|nr:hypothetical protein MP228_002408 [Amoeboaphelidium protococcarum]